MDGVAKMGSLPKSALMGAFGVAAVSFVLVLTSTIGAVPSVTGSLYWMRTSSDPDNAKDSKTATSTWNAFGLQAINYTMDEDSAKNTSYEYNQEYSELAKKKTPKEYTESGTAEGNGYDCDNIDKNHTGTTDEAKWQKSLTEWMCDTGSKGSAATGLLATTVVLAFVATAFLGMRAFATDSALNKTVVVATSILAFILGTTGTFLFFGHLSGYEKVFVDDRPASQALSDAAKDKMAFENNGPGLVLAAIGSTFFVIVFVLNLLVPVDEDGAADANNKV